ncbi:hypothetical protein NM208_g5794 [Fusarium decemcellulare]|uniref:Uncharacterized protein n=1 Tax=Fusarium decemcellulare TaxID=57161 RepID=A0ACC1SFP4_9HYPO|nr:hypothetical protein NM208_g5794 [Fusarium decemcellulare]
MYNSTESSINREILARLDTVERHLRIMRPSSPNSARPLLNHISTDDQLKPSSAKLQNALETDGQTFAGEITMTPVFDDENDNLDCTSTTSSAIRPDYSSPESSLHPPATSPGDLGGRKARGWFESVLIQHGVKTDEQQSRYYLQVYMDEIHAMYPFIHPPTVWETFNEMWQYPSLWSTTDSTEREQVRVSVALVCFCLALGRCSISSRITDPSGVHSSGWSLYNVGMSLLHDLLETSNTATKSLLMLQVLIVRVIYLFRLDANQKAARVHALTVSVAHTTGIHRQSTLENMPAFYNQLYSRAWWVIYMLDRRIAIESGKPYLIQDSNVDTALPIDLSDEWMSRFATRSETISELQHEVAAEAARDMSPSPIPYVIAMVRYSRVAGKTWEVLYGVKASRAPAFAMVEYVDTVLCKLLETAPRDLKYDPEMPYEAQFSTRLRWQVKQTLIFSTCCTYLRLLIRRPLLPSPNSPNHTEDDLESSIECASLAARILTTHQNIKDDVIKYGFALSHYVTSCAMVMIGLVSREPSSKRRYGALILAATQSLNPACAPRVSTTPPTDSRRRQSPPSMRRDSGPEVMLQQLTPQADDQDPRRIQPRVGTSIIYANELNELSIDGSGGVRSDQGSDAYTINRDFASTVAERSTRNAGKTNQLPTSWIGPSIDSQNSWVMSDFNFETLGERFGSNGVEFSTLSDNEKVDAAGAINSIADGEFGEGRLGVLGLSNSFNLDMELGPTMMNFYDTSSMDLDIL